MLTQGWLRCPNHPGALDPAIAGYVAATSWGHVHAQLLADGFCPACPDRRLTDEVTDVSDRLAGRCRCCGGLWLTELDTGGWLLLDTGLLATSYGEWWTGRQAAEHAEVAYSTWRDYVADGRAPQPGPGRDPATGQLRWWADTVRAWAGTRPGRGHRSDLDPRTVNGVHIGSNTIACAELLVELAMAGRVDRAELRRSWLAEFPEDADSQRVSPNRLARDAAARAETGQQHVRLAAGDGTIARKRISTALRALQRVGAIRRDGTAALIITDQALLRRISAL